MKILRATLIMVLMVSSGAVVATDVAIRNVQIHTLDAEQPLQNATLLVLQGRIAAFERDLAVPAGIPIIDGAGMVITPGLVEPHSQIGLE